ncbi:MAG TPA: DUF4126 domain-containing protein [Ktedonobacteraceae bacterium]|nr:DUF4126 domain-containing protein [Ktedonobacteraceae bacterium]
MDLGTPLGLGLASGINAYLPLLALALASRWFHVYTVNEHFTFITSDWCILTLVVLTIADFIADKIPVLDHFWDATHTFVRPLAGALVAAASSHQAPLLLTPASISGHFLNVGNTTGEIQSIGAGVLVIAILGGILAALSHTAKTTTRFVSTITTAGVFNILLSIGEDILVFITILLSLLLPTIMLLLVVLFVLIFGRPCLRAWMYWLRKRGGL